MRNVDEIIQLADNYEQRCQEYLVKIARVRKLPNGKYRVLSQKGKNLGTFDSEKAAKKHLKQVEYFKHLDKSHAEDDKSIIDLTDADEFAYSAMMRKLRQKASEEQVKTFLKLYKAEFDRAVKSKLKKPERVALQNALVKFNKIHKIKLSKKMVKNAAVSELGDSRAVGAYLANIVHFILNRVPPDKRLQARDSLKQKFALMNTDEVASKHLPDSAAIAQSITFVKHVLFNHDSNYIREVLNSLVNVL
jgi:cell division septal protein FtsQ